MTIFGITLSASVLWLIAAAVLAIIEAVTLGLTTIWFAGGAVAASISAMVGAPLWVQGLLFLVVSVLLLYFTRPIVKRKLKVGKEKTNVDAMIGKTGLVIESIRPFSVGQVKVDGLVWSAAAKDSCSTIEKGASVKIEHIEGVKLIVIPCDKPGYNK